MSTLANAYSNAVYSDFATLLDALFDSKFRGLGVMEPCRVVKYDRKTHMVVVQPLIKYVRAGEKNGKDKALVKCTAWRYACGNFVVDVPIKEGDTGWVLSADRDTDVVKRRCKVTDGSGDPNSPATQNPPTGSTHQFRHGLFIPDRWSDFDLYQDRYTPQTTWDPGDGRLTIQSFDGKQRVSIGTFGGSLTINVNAADQVNVVTTNPGSSVNLTTGTLNEIANTAKNVTVASGIGMETINGNVTVNGNLVVTGNITSKTNNITLSSHVHTVGGVSTSSPVKGT